jgi:Tol biopolymer transport system component
MKAHPDGSKATRKLIVFALFAVATAAVIAIPAAATPRGTNGKIVVHTENQATGHDEIYLVDPDGTDRQLLSIGDGGKWSPDGTRISLCAFDGVDDCFSATLNVDDGSLVDLHLERYDYSALDCGTWSPDGTRLACGAFSDADPSLNGVYTVRSSDGGDLQRVFSDPGGEDCVGDYSPNGKQLVISRASETVEGLFTVKLDGSGMRQITPPGMNFNFCNGSWSPQGNEILFSAAVPDSSYRGSIWVVHSDGRGLRQIPVPGCGGPSGPGSIGCFNPSWSPDGKKIVFGRRPGTEQRDIYTVNADGSGLFRLTNTPEIEEFSADWGTHPLTP